MNDTPVSYNTISYERYFVIDYSVVTNFAILSYHSILSYVTTGSYLCCFRYDSFGRNANHYFFLFKYLVDYIYKNKPWIIKENNLSSFSWMHKSVQTFFT